MKDGFKTEYETPSDPILLTGKPLDRVKEANNKPNNRVDWFSEENMSFFNDYDYFVVKDEFGWWYLLRYTSAWTDMFDGVRKYHFKLNDLDQQDLKIGRLIDNEFKTIEEVKEYLNI